MLDIDTFLSEIVHRLRTVQGVQAVVLGGSYAAGAARNDSDIDLGLYYHPNQPLDIAQLRNVAAQLNDEADPIVTDPGGWGPWVNGGAWLTIKGQRVDFLYRDIDFVFSTLTDCNAGRIRSDYWQQPAYGFHSFMYCGETAICRPLYDPQDIIKHLKNGVENYSPLLKQAIIRQFLWSARFTLDNITKAARRSETYMVVGGLARAIHCLVQVLYALNEQYYLSEKRLAHDISTFRLRPLYFLQRITRVLGAAGTTAEELQQSVVAVEALYNELFAFSQEQEL